MIEIIPNWHPIFVHFTVALFSISVLFYILHYLFSKLNIFPWVKAEFEIVGRWCLWTVGILVIGTVLAGFNAYNTVQHDAPSHLAMTDHRNWAVPTAGLMILVALWSFWQNYKRKSISIIFIIALLIVQGMLLSTAWRGAELVFRYGLGVMSLPQGEELKGHHHDESILNPNLIETPTRKNPEHNQEHLNDHNH